MKPDKPLIKKSLFSPISLVISTSLICFLYIFMEWVFIVTKPSFINSASFLEKVFIFLNTASLLSVFSIFCLVPFIILYAFQHSKKVNSILGVIFSFFPTIILTSLILLMVDNFTYTVFKFGIVSSKGIIRILYAGAFTGLGFVINRKVLNFTKSIERNYLKNPNRYQKLILPFLAFFLSVCIALPIVFNSNAGSEEGIFPNRADLSKMPNIILITGDGIDASKLSLYGYEKDTTPFLKALSSQSLFAENAFSNAQGTVGSITSMLTGKYPADTRVLTTSDILRGDDAFQHLPAILKNYGYFTVQLSYSYYADAYNVNIQNGFNEANGRSPQKSRLDTYVASLLPANYYYFIQQVLSRVSDRLGHIFFLKDMANPYLQVTEAPEKFDDLQKLDYAISLLNKTEKPLFIHLHWMGTHGPKYHPDQQFFSAGQNPDIQEKFNANLYLDSILEFDRAVAIIFKELENRNLQDNSILIVASDHTQRWSLARLPLIIRFPHSEYSKIITENVQNMDIAPTLLDYLGIEQPSWMDGQSLLTNLIKNRPIFLMEIGRSSKDLANGEITYPEAKPPFFQFGKISVIICDRWYQLNLEKLTLTDGNINSRNGSCSNQKSDKTIAIALIVDHFRKYGFDTSSLNILETGK
ncbi:MAG: sulfatase [Chloroflexi bacterium]|nr:MAG: sulfatase [Chloroflexota bacterium]MBA4376326.1 hypothetical protein [Anaerolinea sp.]